MPSFKLNTTLEMPLQAELKETALRADAIFSVSICADLAINI